MSQILQTVRAFLHPQDAKRPGLHSEAVGTIGVVVGRDLVGDSLIKLPFLRALRNAFPKASIHWITSQGATAYATVLRPATQHLIDVIHEQPAWILNPTSLSAAAPAPPFFDLLIDTRNHRRDALIARQLPHGLFLATAMRYLFSDRRPVLAECLWNRPPHICDRMLQLVELAAGYQPISTGSLPVPEELRYYAKLILPEGASYIGLAPGAGNPAKIWPRYKFEKIAALQVAKGRIPVFILGPQELASYDALSAAVPQAKFPLQDYETWKNQTLSIDHTLAIAQRLDIAVANDSGVGHMLAAVDCPLISLFGPTSPEKLAPRVTRSKVIRAQDFGGSVMKLIRWETVDAALDGMLNNDPE